MGGMIGDPGDYNGPEGLTARMVGVIREAWEALGNEPFAGEYRRAHEGVVATIGEIVQELRGEGLSDEGNPRRGPRVLPGSGRPRALGRRDRGYVRDRERKRL